MIPPATLLRALERGVLTKKQIRELIECEADELGLTLEEAQQRAVDGTLSKCPVGTHIGYLFDMLNAGVTPRPDIHVGHEYGPNAEYDSRKPRDPAGIRKHDGGQKAPHLERSVAPSIQCQEREPCESTAKLTKMDSNAAQPQQFPERETCHSEETPPQMADTFPDIFPDSRGDRPVRVGTVYLDEATGEYVMPPDFFGEKELRWKADPPLPQRETAINLEQGERKLKLPIESSSFQADSSQAILDYSTAEDYSTLEGQERLYEENFPRAVADTLRDLQSGAYVSYIHDLGLERLRKGHPVFGDEMYRWHPAVRQANADEEMADNLVYRTSEP